MDILKMLGAMIMAAAILCGLMPARTCEVLLAGDPGSAGHEVWADFVTDQRKKLLEPLVRTPVKMPARGFILKGAS